MTANNSWGCDLKQVVGRIDPRTGVATDSIDPAKRIRCETLESMRGLAATKAFVDCPIHLTPAEAQAILELAEDRAALLADWASALQLGARYARITQRLVLHAGYPSYAAWLEVHRVRRLEALLEALQRATGRPAN